MTETSDTAATVLVVGEPSAHAASRLARLEGSCEMVPIANADPLLLADGLAGRVRGIAAFGAVGAAFIDALPRLEIIASFGVGYDAVDAAQDARDVAVHDRRAAIVCDRGDGAGRIRPHAR